MFSNALIGIDELDGGRDPVALARKLCAPTARLTLARVHGAYQLHGPLHADSLHDAQIRIAEATLKSAARATGISDSVAVGAVSTGDGLSRLAAERHNDLIVIGSRRRGEVGVVSVNDWLAHLLARAGCAVAVAPLGYVEASEPIRTIGVAFDDSDESQHALAVARRIASEQGSHVAVFEPPARSVAGHRSDDWITDDLAEFSSGVDLLVLGPRGAGVIRRMTHPSMTLALVHRARSPLLLVTHRTRTPWGDEYPQQEEWTSKPPRAAERIAER